MTNKLKTRFAPSPTGAMHLGNLRTAFFNYLLAKATNGSFLLRIEDTDTERSKLEYQQQLFDDLRWLGLDWDEGPEAGGNNGPYLQSQRTDIHDDYYQKLQAAGRAYPCFCSDAQLKLSRKLQLAQGLAPKYPGTCRDLSEEAVAAKIAAGERATLRFRVDPTQTVTFEDAVKGKQSFDANLIGDFIIRRQTGAPSFMFANAIDDSMMQVKLVMRGEDHLTNTPRQLMILQALDLPAPQYGHISLILGADGSPLSKRHGSKSIKQLREQGFLPAAILNYLARCGHSYDQQELLPLAALAKNFKLDNLSKSGAHFDQAQLNYWQKETVLHSDLDILNDWLPAAIKAQVPESKLEAFELILKENISLPAEAEVLAQQFFAANLDLSSDSKDVISSAGANFFNVASSFIANNGADFKALSSHLKTELAVKGKGLFQPLRTALTGVLHGPEMDKIFAVMGADQIINRFDAAKKICDE